MAIVTEAMGATEAMAMKRRSKNESIATVDL